MTRSCDLGLMRCCALFTGMTDRDAAAFLARCDVQVFRPGHRIVVEGREGHEFFVILDGEAAVTVGERVVARLGAGDFFGEAAPLRHVRRTASVTATTQLRCLSLANDAVVDALRESPRLTYNMLLALVDRVCAADAAVRRPLLQAAR